MNYPNKDDFDEKFWKNNYLVTVTAQGIEFTVNADCEQAAIDYVIDYCDEIMPGLVAPYSELIEEGYTDTEINDYICGGNAGLYLTTHNINIETI